MGNPVVTLDLDLVGLKIYIKNWSNLWKSCNCFSGEPQQQSTKSSHFQRVRAYVLARPSARPDRRGAAGPDQLISLDQLMRWPAAPPRCHITASSVAALPTLTSIDQVLIETSWYLCLLNHYMKTLLWMKLTTLNQLTSVHSVSVPIH